MRRSVEDALSQTVAMYLCLVLIGAVIPKISRLLL